MVKWSGRTRECAGGHGCEGEWAGGSLSESSRDTLTSRLRASRVNECSGLPFFHARLFLSLSGIRRLSWMRLRIGVMVFGEVAPRSAPFEAQGKQGKRASRTSVFSCSTISFAIGNPQAIMDAFANRRTGLCESDPPLPPLHAHCHLH